MRDAKGAGGRRHGPASVLRATARGLDTLLDRTVVLGYPATGYEIRRRLPVWPADPAAGSLAGRDVIVTGASSGLGIETVRLLAALGGRIHCVVRDVAKAHRALVEAAPAAQLEVWRCDLADLDSVAAFAGELATSLGAEGRRLSAIVHNAGLMPPVRTLRDGRELSMTVHVVAPVLLTDLLLPVLEPSARVVFVTSGGMYAQRLRVDDLAYEEGPYHPAVAYARSKRAQVELLGPLARRWAPVGVCATHPGWAASPGLLTSLPGFARLLGPVLRRGSAGVDTTTWLVATPELSPGVGVWHDRRLRPTSYLPWLSPPQWEREQLMSWVDAQLEPIHG